MKKQNEIILIFLVLGIILTLIIMLLVQSIETKEKCYEYYLNGEFGTSNNCVYKNDAYCEIGNKVIKVENYYEVE
jgi:hypothetical protein